ARQVVQTCVLSKRWRHLLRSVPCLDVDHDEFKKTARASEDGSYSSGDHSSDSNDDQWRHHWRRPWLGVGLGVDRNVFNTVIASDDNSDSLGDDNSDSDDDIHDSDDDTPDSDSDSDGDCSGSNLGSSDANVDDDNHKDKEKDKDWEDFEDFTANLMLRCNIAQLDSFRLHIIGSRAPEFGDRQAADGSHVGLSSGSWCLKRLHLCHVILDNHFVKHVRSVCHSLEDLDLDDCTCKIRSITSHSLKTLILKNCRWCNLSKITSTTLKTLVIDGSSNTDDCVLVILAPAVAYLHLAVNVDHFCGGISITRYGAFTSRLCGDQFKFLCSISKVTSLELSGVGTKSSPILEKLTLRHCQFPKCPNKKKGTPILNKISSSVLHGLDLLCENLKVEIIYRHGYGPHLLQLLLRVSVNLSQKKH
uniref:F-box domain-containing protein n=1 Tax=Setaria italica TaxID=4555 RepID=K3ZL70_SETIT